jgi:acyl dehydratase
MGQTISRSRVFTQEQFDRFAALSGDDNPIHVDPDFSARTKFGRTVAHGMFLYANIAQVMGEFAPGALPAAQELTFPAPTFAGEPVRIQLTAGERTAGGLSVATEVVTNAVSGDRFGCRGSALLRERPGSPPDLSDFPKTDRSGEPAVAWKGLTVGQSAAMSRAYGEADLRDYLDLLQDGNPLYRDSALAAAWGLRGVPLPGPLLGALFSCLLGARLPGPGTNWLKQRFVFLAAAHPGDALEAQVQITRIRTEKELVNLRTWINVGGTIICDGEALVWVSDLAAGS